MPDLVSSLNILKSELLEATARTSDLTELDRLMFRLLVVCIYDECFEEIISSIFETRTSRSEFK